MLACVADVFVHGFHVQPRRGPRGIAASTKPSVSSWGESITAIIEAVQPDGTIVTIYSESANPLGLLDWGRNRHNVQMLITQVGWRLAPGGPPMAGGPPGPGGPPGQGG